jgi:hypothetical protein
MIILYGLLTLAGFGLTVILIQQRSWSAFSALAGTVLAGLAIPTGFSIGTYLAAASLPFLVIAVARVRHRRPVA